MEGTEAKCSTGSYSEMTLDEYNQLIREQKLKRIIK